MSEIEVGRFGNLNGAYGVSSDVIGIGIGDYFTGLPNMLYRSDTGTLSFNVHGTPYLKFEYNAGNPRVWLGGSENVVQLTQTGLDVGSSGHILGGQTGYNTGTGFWLGYAGSAYKFSIGNGSTQSLVFDGTNLSISGGITASTGSIGGFKIGANTISDTADHLVLDSTAISFSMYNKTFGQNGLQLEFNGGLPRFYVGNGIGQYFKFGGTAVSFAGGNTSLTEGGLFTAYDAVITGDITASTGAIGGWTIKGNTIEKKSGVNGIALRSDLPAFILSGTGGERVYIGQDGADYVMRLKNSSGGIIFNAADASNVLAGWNLSTTTLSKNNATLDSAGALTLGTSNDIVKLDATDGTYRLWAGNATAASAPFSVSKAGAVKATSGVIGGWTLNSDYLASYYDNALIHKDGYIRVGTGNNIVEMNAINSLHRLWVGHTNSVQAPFKVDTTGGLYAISGTLGGFYLQNGNFTSSNNRMRIDGNGNNIVLYNPAGGSVLTLRGGGTSYAIESTGFKVDNLGQIIATAGTIGGWTINTEQIYNDSFILNATDKRFSIGSVLFGYKGIQMLYDATDGGNFYVGDGANAYIKYDGALTWKASNSSLDSSGNIQLAGGTIGGWTISSSTLTGGTTNIILDSTNKAISINNSTYGQKGVQLEYNAGTPRFYTGDGSTKYFKFDGTNIAFAGVNTSLTEAGLFTAANAVLTGSITAGSGAIGGWTISAGKLSTTNINIDSANQRISSSDYVSGVNGAGFLISKDLIETNNISARGMIKTAVFQKDTVSSIGGNFAVLNSDVLITDMSAADSQHIIISGTSSFSSGDILRIKDGEDDEWLEVTSVSNNNYTVTRDKASSYSANANPAWKKGASVISYGQSGDGGLFFTASESNAPYMEVFDHAGSPWSAINTRVRLGNLNGYLGYNSDIYGLGVGSSAGTAVNLTIDPTNGFRLRNGTTNKFVVDQSGNVGIYDSNILLTSGNGSGNYSVQISPDDASIRFYDGEANYTTLANNLLSVSNGNGGFSVTNRGVHISTSNETLLGRNGALWIYNGHNYNTKSIYITSGTALGYGKSTGYFTSDGSYNLGLGNIKINRNNIYINRDDQYNDKRSIEIYQGNEDIKAPFIYLENQDSIYDYFDSALFIQCVSGSNTFYTTNVFTVNRNGKLFVKEGIIFSTEDDDNKKLSTNPSGDSSTTMYIGNKSIDTSVPSDGRLKSNIVSTNDSLEDLIKLKVKDFTFKKEYRSDIDTIEKGLIAQELLETYPYPVKKLESGFYEVEYKKLIPLLIKSVQDLNYKVEQQKLEIEQLKSYLNKI